MIVFAWFFIALFLTLGERWPRTNRFDQSVSRERKDLAFIYRDDVKRHHHDTTIVSFSDHWKLCARTNHCQVVDSKRRKRKDPSKRWLMSEIDNQY